MKTLDEKRLLARMTRNIGQPDLDLEESIRHEEELFKKLFKTEGVVEQKTMPTGVLVEDKLFNTPGPTSNIVSQGCHLPTMVDAAAEAISNTPSITKPPTLVEKLRDAELDGIRGSIRDMMAKIGTLSWGGGGTGIVRMEEADDVSKVSLSQDNAVIIYKDKTFQATQEIPVTGNLIISNTASSGILLNPEDPSYGWRDIIGNVQPKAIGVGSPARALYRGNIYDYIFVLNDQTDFVFHLPHDYVIGSDLYFHVHWSHTGTSISGTAEFTIYHMYARGHNQEDFEPEKTLVISYPTVDVATTPRYRHRIDELRCSAAVANAAVMASSDLEPDGLLVATLKLTGLPTIGGGGLFIHTCDLHYQSTNMATLGKAPNFYTDP